MSDDGFLPDQEAQPVASQDGFVPDQQFIPDAPQKPPVDTTAMKNYVDKNLAAYQASDEYKIRNPDQHPAKNFWEAAKAGLQGSSMGLAFRNKMPDTVMPGDSSFGMDIAQMAGQTVGDLLPMTVGSFVGEVGGAEAGGVPGAIAGAGAGAFAAPAAIRKMYMDHFQRGDIVDAHEFATRFTGTLWDAAKAGAVGVATAGAGALAKPIGTIAKSAAELATMTTVGKAIEGQLPTYKDFAVNAVALGGFHVAGMVSRKLQNIYAATGQHPAEIAQEAENNPQLKAQLLSHDPELPIQAADTTLKHWTDVPGSAELDTEGKPITPPQEKQWLLQSERGSISRAPILLKAGTDLTPAEQELAQHIGKTEAPEPDSIQQKFKEFYANNIDKTDPLKSMVDAYTAETGERPAAENDPHIQARLFASHHDLVRSFIKWGLPDKDGNFTGDSLEKIYNEAPDQAKFDLYSIARRAQELDDRGIVTGMKRETADQVVSDGGDTYEALHRRRVNVLNQALDYGVKQGIFDADKVEASKEQNKEYIPFGRVMPIDELTGVGEIGKGKLLQKIEGSDLDLKNPRYQIYQNVAATFRRAEINRIRLMALDGLTRDTGMIDDQTGEPIMANPDLREVPISKGGLKSNQIAIFRDGEMSALEGKPLTIDSLRRLEGDPTSMGLTLKIFRSMANGVRVGTVGDPGFGFRHFFRAGVSTFFYTKTGQIPFVHAMMNMSEFFGQKSNDFKTFVSKGGMVSGVTDLQRDYIDNNLQAADEKYPFLSQTWNTITKPFDAVHAFIQATDNLSRFTEYKRAIAQGKTPTEAAFLAREVSPDYAKNGIQRSALRTTVAFIGTHINSLDRMAQAFKEDATGTMLKMSAMSAVSAMLWYANKDDKEIEDLPDYIKDLRWNFRVPGTDYVMGLPKPWSPGIIFGSGVERALDAFVKHDPHAFDGFGKTVWDSLVPNVTPTGFAPILDQITNKNLFTGRQLVSQRAQHLLPEMQYQPYTSETAKKIGQILGYVPFVKDIGPSSDPLSSPQVIENYIRGYTGIMGGWALKLGDAAIHEGKVMTAKTDAERAQIQNTGPGSVASSPADLPILNEFMVRFPSAKTQPLVSFANSYQEISRIQNSIKIAEKNGDMATALELSKAHPEAMISLQEFNKAISNGHKMIDMIQNQDFKSSPVEKRQLIDSNLFKMNSIAKMGNQMIDGAKQSRGGK